MCLVLEFLEKSLYQVEMKEKGLSIEFTRIIAYQVLKGLEIIHSQGMIHSDLKVIFVST